MRIFRNDLIMKLKKTKKKKKIINTLWVTSTWFAIFVFECVHFVRKCVVNVLWKWEMHWNVTLMKFSPLAPPKNVNFWCSHWKKISSKWHFRFSVSAYVLTSSIVTAIRSWAYNFTDHDDVIKWKHFPRYWQFVRRTTGHRWIPLTKASDAELWCFLWSAPG